MRNLGDSVLIYDALGNMICRGKIISRIGDDLEYEIQPRGTLSLADCIKVKPWQIRSVGLPYMAYEKANKVTEPQHILDEV